MNTLYFLAFHVGLAASTSLDEQTQHCITKSSGLKGCGSEGCDPGTSEISQDGEMSSAGDSCQRKSSSLVQVHAVKMRVEPESSAPAAAAPAESSHSSGDAVGQGMADVLPQAASHASTANAREDPGEQRLLTEGSIDGISVAPMIKHETNGVNTVVAKTDAAAVMHESAGLNLTAGTIAGVDTVPTVMSSAGSTAASSPGLKYAAEKAEMPVGQEVGAAPTADAVAQSGMPTVRQMNTVPVAQSNADAVMPSDRESSSVEADDKPSQSSSEGGTSWGSDIRKGIKEMDQFLRGKPQVLSIFVMMLLPAGICAVMCCIFNIIRLMEDAPNGRDDLSSASDSVAQNRPMLGEGVRPNAAAKGPYEPLCAELLAPGENESIIALPSLNEVGSGVTQFERTIGTKTGAPIVTARVAVSRVSDGMADAAGGGSYGVPGQMLERISLIAFKKQNALGFCELRVPNGGISAARPLKCEIRRPTGDLFATLEEESTGVVSSLLATNSSAAPRGYGAKCYMLTTIQTGTRFWIQGDIEKRSLVVVSEKDEQKPIITVDSGEDLQFKREDNNYYRLRVQPKADAGVVILALLAIDRLRASHA